MKATTERQRMMIRFDGDNHQIDANTLISVLSHYNNIINLANQEYGQGSRDVRLSVEALRKGSFEIIMSLNEGIKTLFSKETAEYLAALVTVVGGIFGIYKVFKGRPVKTDEEKNIVKNVVKGDNNIINTTINVYNTPITREAVSKSFERANEDANVDGMSVMSDCTEAVTFPKEDFPSLIYKDFDKENLPKERAVFENNAILRITALNFVAGGNWKFVFNGFQISMMVKDDALMKAIDSGARFGKGDSLRVKLKLNQRYDEQLQAFVNVSYRIEEFYEHIPMQTQGSLFEE